MNHPPLLQADQLYIPSIALGVDKVAESLSLSKTAVFWLIKQKHLPSFKIGKRRLVRVMDLDILAEKLVSGEIVIRLTEDAKVAQ